jgi:acyl carrier protein
MTSGDDVTVAARTASGASMADAYRGVSAAAVHEVFADALGVRVPDDDTDVIATGLLDSLGIAELLLTLEERFGITIDMATLDLDDVRSVRSITELVTDLCQSRSS